MRTELRARGIDARLLTSTADPPDEQDPPDYTFRGSTGPLRALRETVNPDAVRVVRRVVGAFDPQVVHLGMILTQASPAVLPAFGGRPVLWVPNEYRPICPRGTRLLPDGRPCPHPVGLACLRNHCFGPPGLAPRLVQLAMLRHWRPLIDHVVSPSRAFADELERHGVSVDEVVPHGVLISPAADPSVVVPNRIGFAGRLVPEKGAHTVIEALALLPPSMADIRLVIAGDGPDRAVLDDLVTRLGLGSRVEFTGHLSRQDVQRCMASVALQIVPSLWAEPFGLVVVEAMARGTPVLASATGALPELLEDGRTGYLCPPGDPARLAARMVEVLADRAHLAAVGREAMRVAGRAFNVERLTDRFLEIYADLRRRKATAS
jgi:glycosyltransferase involved in cell wall biosynthesis